MTKIGEIYRKFHGRFISRPTNFSWIVPNKLAGSGLPSSYDHLLWFIKNDIKTVVTVREIPLPEEWIKKIHSLDLMLECFFLKTDDYDAPPVIELCKVVDYIDNQININRSVVVHCAAGKGRTGTILAAYLIKKYGLNAEDAIKRIRLLRPGSVQSERQKIAIDTFFNLINKK